MDYYIIEPEVAGGIGKNTIYEECEESNRRYEIKHLHFVFEGWLGDQLLEVTPCFLVSEKIKNAIQKNMLTGCSFQDVEISCSEEFVELNYNKNIPLFYRMIPLNVFDEKENYNDNNTIFYDFMITENKSLVISEKAKKILEENKAIEHAELIMIKGK